MDAKGVPPAEAQTRRLRLLRARLGLSQEQLAQRLGVSFATVNRWETGRTTPAARTERLIADLEAADGAPPATPRRNGRSPDLPVTDGRDPGPGTAERASADGQTDDGLPMPQSSFVGRLVERAELQALVRAHRLVCVTGPGGAGKTRLVLEAVRERPTGQPVVFVALEPVRDPSGLLSAVAAALGTRDEPDVATVVAVGAALRGVPRLVVLDGAEHLADAVGALLPRLLDASPDVRVVVTSRQVIGVAGELSWGIPALGCPDPDAGDDEIATADAVELFVTRARERLTGFDARRGDPRDLAVLCRRLGGLPLAIELLAGWVATLSVAEILERGSALLVTSEPDVGPGALDAVIRRSWELLGPTEQALLPVLSVFAGAFGLDDAGAVAGQDDGTVIRALRALVDSSWLSVRTDQDRNRFVLLDTTRAFAAARLHEVGATSETEKRHAAHFAEVAEGSESGLAGPDSAAWVARMESASADLEVALAWADRCDETGLGLAISAALWRWWLMAGRVTVGRAWLARFVDRTGRVDDVLTARGRCAAALLAAENGDYREAIRLGRDALGTLEAAGSLESAALAATVVGSAHRYLGEHPVARRYFETAMDIRARLDDRRGVSVALNNMALATFDAGDPGGAIGLFERSIAIKRRLGDPRSVAVGLANLSEVLISTGAFREAGIALEEAAALAENLASPQLLGTLRCNQGDLHASRQEFATAVSYYRAGLAAYRQASGPHGVVTALVGLGRSLARTGATGEAVVHLREAESLAAETGRDGDLRDVRAALDALAAGPAPPSDLTVRQAEVLRLVAAGRSNKEIAGELGLRPTTVERHLSTVYRRLGLRGRVEAARWAIAHDLVAARDRPPGPG
jgi:predicted ATPase/DNA-binding NarL/FixJ family response regulator/transcriptional regulator with XRE-family HTH domain